MPGSAPAREELAGMAAAAAAGGLDWVQAAGGNASVKDAGSLWVKSSGIRLGELTPAQGWVRMDLGGLRAVLDDPGYLKLAQGRQQDEAGKAVAALKLEGDGRPSLEAGFHALGGRACLHLHLVKALGPLCLEESQDWFEETLKECRLSAAWAGYRPPGHSLALEVRRALESRPGAELVLMKNHGVIAYAPDGGKALEKMESLEQALGRRLGAMEPPVYHAAPRLFEELGPALAGMIGPKAHWKVSHEPWVMSLALGGVWDWQPLCPDDPIYAGLKVPCLEEAPGPEALEGLFGPAPRQAALGLKGLGMLLAARDARALGFLEEMLYANAKARALARRQGTLAPLSRERCLEVLGMEGEKYRQEMK